MPTVETISIALPAEMVTQLRQAVDTGEYASSSEVVREALREWRYSRQIQQVGIQELRQLWQEARSAKDSGVEPDEVLDGLEQKYQIMADASGR